MIAPTISVILTCYKEGVLLENAIASLDAQTIVPCELVVVNDASPCRVTNSICERLRSRQNTVVITHVNNGGLSIARNTGFKAASGDVCVLLDGDDVLPVDSIERVRDAFAAHSDADFCFGDYIQCNTATGEKIVVDCSVLADPGGRLLPDHLAAQWRLLGTSPCRRSLWRKIKGYRASFSFDCQDVDFWMRAVAAGGRGFYIKGPIYQWNRSPQGMNAAVLASRQWEVFLANSKFLQIGHAWEGFRDSFVDHVLRAKTDSDIRRIMRRYCWSMFPVPAALQVRFVRALIICWLPLPVAQRILKMKEALLDRK